MCRKAEIEREFDEPLRDVVVGFAEMGWSRSLVADALDVSVESLKSWCRRSDVKFPRSPMEHREIKGRPPRLVEHNGRTQSLTAWAWDLGVAPCTIHKRLRRCGRVC